MSEAIMLDKIMEEAESGDGDAKNVTKVLISIVLNSGELFHDQFGNGYFALEGNGSKIMKIRAKEFKTWLAHLGWKRLGKPVSSNILQTIVSTLEGKAVHEGSRYTLHLRVANYDGAVWYDLGTGSAVKVNKNGWEVVSQPPILFYRLSHQKPQVTPVSGGDMQDVFNFLPEPPDGDERLLLLVWLATALLPGFSHPILLVHGEKGSRKTTLFKLLRELIDPSALQTMTAQSDVAGFVQQASHHYFLPLDNLSPVHHNFSDILCRVVTGEGFSKRELYSDDDDIIYSFQRLVGVNGINMVLDKPDVLDRSLIINLTPPEKYETEEKLFGEFNDAKPRLLGALFDLIVLTMRAYDDMPEIQGLERYRMASFVKWGCAAVLALGNNIDSFINALDINRQQQQDEVLETSPVALTLNRFVAEFAINGWHGTPTLLLSELKRVAGLIQIDPNRKPFPQNVNWLWKRLEEVIPNLRDQGILISRERNNERLIHIELSRPATLNNVDSGPDGSGYSFEDIEQRFSSDSANSGTQSPIYPI